MEHLDTVMKVIARLKKKKFSYLDEDDLSQEAFLIAVEVIPQWDGVRSLENFLMVAISRRLISLARSYYRNPEKKASLDFFELKDCPIEAKLDLDSEDTIDFLLRELPPSMRNDFRRLVDGVSLPPTRRASLLSKVKEVLDGQR
jgi:DNA-directed RNA polymerase specialized sigma24 family protein